MPKIFSDEEKQFHKNFLLDNGLRVIMENGYKHVTVDQLVQMIGASKGYFYLLFPSKEDFFLDALAWQMEKNYKQLEEAVKKGFSSAQIAELYKEIFKNRMHFANHEDAAYVQQKISDEQWNRFQEYQESFFLRTIKLLGRDTSQCDPKIVSNLSAIIFLLYNSRDKYLFAERSRKRQTFAPHLSRLYFWGSISGPAPAFFGPPGMFPGVRIKNTGKKRSFSPPSLFWPRSKKNGRSSAPVLFFCYGVRPRAFRTACPVYGCTVSALPGRRSPAAQTAS